MVFEGRLSLYGSSDREGWISDPCGNPALAEIEQFQKNKEILGEDSMDKISQHPHASSSNTKIHKFCWFFKASNLDSKLEPNLTEQRLKWHLSKLCTGGAKIEYHRHC